MADYQVVSEFKGYRTKPDPTNTDERYLIAGSKNVLINDQEKVTNRNGYSLLGPASTDRNGIESSYTWETSSNSEITLRGLNNKLQFEYEGTWYDLASGYNTAQFDFAPFWDGTTEQIDLLLYVAKDANIYDWSGMVTTLASATVNTITKNGTETWAESRALTNGTRSVIINGTEYTYTGGENTTTLTGVTPDPSGEAANSVVYQSVRTNTNQPASGLTNDLIEILNNQVYVGDYTSREVYVSQQGSFTDFTFSSPRQPSEGALLTLDATPRAFIVQEDSMYISAGKNDWYKTTFTLTTTSTVFVEDLTIDKLKTTSQQACIYKDAVVNGKNNIVFISHEPTFEELGRVENLVTPQSKPLSDPIKPDFSRYDFTNSAVAYWKNQFVIAVPNEQLVLIYDIENGWWQPPQTMAISSLTVYQGQLIGHSSLVSESYVLFDENETSDNGALIEMQAVFAYRNFGSRFQLKNFNEYACEGYLSSNTNLTVTLQYDYEGASGNRNYEIKGADESIAFGTNVVGGLGSSPLGHLPLGGLSVADTEFKKFRHIKKLSPNNFHELLVTISTTDDNAQFEILSHGPQAQMSSAQNNSIRK